MLRDADDHNAKWYATLVKKYLLQIKDPNKLDLLEDCVAYMEKAATFWEEYIVASSESEQNIAEKYTYSSEKEIIAAVSLCEENYNGDPSEETSEHLINALEDAMDYYQKAADEIRYLKYASEYLVQKERQFVLDPDSFEAVIIVLSYDDLVQFLINKEKLNDAIEILNRKIKFLDYLYQIGGQYAAEYSATLALLTELHRKIENFS